MGISDRILKGEKKEIAIASNILIKNGDKEEIKKLTENLPNAGNFSKIHIKKILQIHGDNECIDLLFKTLLKELENKEEQNIKDSSLTIYLISRRANIKNPERAKKIIEYTAKEDIPKKYLFLLIGAFGEEAEGEYLKNSLSSSPEEEKPFIIKGLILTKYKGCKEIIQSTDLNLLKESIYEILENDDLTEYLLKKARNLGEDFIKKMLNIIKNGKPKNSKLIINEMIKDTNSPFFNDFIELAKKTDSDDTVKIIEELLNTKRKEEIEKTLFSAYIEIKKEFSIKLILELFPKKSSIIQSFVLNEYFSKNKNISIDENLSYKIRDLWLKLFKIGENEDLKVAVLKSFKYLTFSKEEDYIFIKSELLSHYKKHEEMMPDRIKNNMGPVLKEIRKKADVIHIKKVVLKEIEKFIELYEKERKEEYIKALLDKLNNIDSSEFEREYREQKEEFFLKLIENNKTNYNMLENNLKIIEKFGTKKSLAFLEKLKEETEFYGIKILLPKMIDIIRLREGLPQKISFIYENLFYLKKLIKEGLEKYGFKMKEIDKLGILNSLEQRFHSVFIDLQNVLTAGSETELINLIESKKFDYYIIIYNKEEELEKFPLDRAVKLEKPFNKEKVEKLIEEIII
jgi:hypothetical protein